MPSFLKLLVMLLLLFGGGPRLVAGQSVQQPDGRKPFPHFRPAEKRKLRHYKPRTWREKLPAPKPPATVPDPPR